MSFWSKDDDVNTSSRGLIGHTAVLNELVRKGKEVLMPWGDHRRYDLAFVEPLGVSGGMKLIRVQCKVARLSKDGGYLLFNAFSVTIRVGGKTHLKKGYQDDIEYFAVYSPDTEKIYMVPVEDVAYTGETRLRLKPSRNGQKQGVRWAKDYEF